MSDTELLALAALAQVDAIRMAGENRSREIQGLSPAWCSEGTGMMPASERMREELNRRGINVG